MTATDAFLEQAHPKVALSPAMLTDRLPPLLARVHDDAVRGHAREVTVDLRGAGPLGSAGIQHLVGWLLDIQDLPPDTRYAVHLIGDEGDHWQRRGLEWLHACAAGRLTLSFQLSIQPSTKEGHA